jgi:hypothetical protein
MKNSRTLGRDYYLALYQQWKSSGLSVGLFCLQTSVKYATFRYWVKKIEESNLTDSGFTELRMSSGGPPRGSSEPIAVLNFPGGASLSFYRLPDTIWLKTLLS